MTEATQQGVSEAAENVAPETQVNPRLAFIEDLADQYDDVRDTELHETMDADPGLKHNQDAMDEVESDLDPEGVISVEPIVPAVRKPGSLPDFVVEQDGEYYLQTTIDGQSGLIPLDRARAQIQKEVAVETRFDLANRQLADIARREQEFNERIAQQQAVPVKQPPPSVDTTDVDDEALNRKAKQLVNSLFTEDEDEAAVKLAEVLRSNRAPTAAPVDPSEIINRTTAAVMNTIQAERRREAKAAMEADVAAGFNQFRHNYQDIANDPNLFRVADGMTDDIAREHPDWRPSQVMTEAGERTRAWVGANNPVVAEPPSNDRQTRKAQLTPMPRTTSMRHEVPSDDGPETPSQAFARMKEARGQPV